MIGIVDYGMGNLFSVSKALERLDAPYFISQYTDGLLEADALLVPGVGSFRDAMEALNRTGLTQTIRDFAATGKHFNLHGFSKTTVWLTFPSMTRTA